MLLLNRTRNLLSHFKDPGQHKTLDASYIQVGSMYFKIQTTDPYFDHFIKRRYSTFSIAEDAFPASGYYSFSFYPARQISGRPNFRDINFFGTHFYYRQHGESNAYEVIIPKTYEDWQVNNFFKLFFASRCLHHDMILIHASMIIRSGTAVLFIGQSGAGKSTISNLSGYPVVHDDNVALTITGDNKFLCRSIPFKEPYHKKSFEGSIDCIYRLFQSHTTFLKEVPLPQQYMYLLFSLWSFDGFENAATREYNKQVAGYLQRIHKMTCVKELHFEKNKAFMELI